MKTPTHQKNLVTESTATEPYLIDEETAYILKDLTDPEYEVTYDRLTALAAKLLNAPVAIISIANAEDQYFKSFNGLGQEWIEHRIGPRTPKYCREVVTTGVPLLISDARLDPVLSQDPVTQQMGVVAYLGIPMTLKNGSTLGSYCAIDTKPRKWSKKDISILTLLNESLMREIELRLALRMAEAAKERAVKANDSVVAILDRMLDSK